MHTETYWRDQAMDLAALLARTLNLVKQEAETMTALSDALAASQANTAAQAHAASAAIAQLKADKQALADQLAAAQSQLATAQQTAEDPNVMQALIDGENAIGAELAAATQG